MVLKTRQTTDPTRSNIRRKMRWQRNQLSAQQQQQAARSLVPHLLAHILKQNYQHIALYLANDGELNPQHLAETLWQKDIQLYLPRLHPFSSGHLIFLHYTPSTPMINNHYGIAEPVLNASKLKPVHELDLILTPLVAFDNQGNRLGMGGGFYDRTLAAHNAPPAIGLAHNCQQIEHLPTEAWDMPLSAIATPTKILTFPN